MEKFGSTGLACVNCWLATASWVDSVPGASNEWLENYLSGCEFWRYVSEETCHEFSRARCVICGDTSGGWRGEVTVYSISRALRGRIARVACDRVRMRDGRDRASTMI